MDLERRRSRIRQKVSAGELVRSSMKDFSAGPGQGSACTSCGETIGPGDTEFEFRTGVRLDATCFKIWLEELATGSSSASPL